jgi:hypothetical protein
MVRESAKEPCPVRPLSILKSLAISETGFRLEFEGGHVFEYRCEQEAETPARVIETTGETVTGPGVARCLPSNVVTLRRRSA